MTHNPFTLFLTAFLIQTAGYFSVVGFVFLAIWRVCKTRLRGARISGKERFSAKQLKHEILHSLVTLLFGALLAVTISLLYMGGHTRLKSTLAGTSMTGAVATVIALVVFNDAWFYFWHRLLHSPRLFRLVHAVHHKSVDVNPFSSYSFHAVEGLLLSAWALPAVVLVPLPLPLLGVLQAVGFANNLMSHLGYEFLPIWYIRVPPFSWMSTATYHSLHHSKFNGNYGLFFRFWDRLLGTEIPGYDAKFLSRGAASTPTALS